MCDAVILVELFGFFIDALFIAQKKVAEDGGFLFGADGMDTLFHFQTESAQGFFYGGTGSAAVQYLRIRELCFISFGRVVVIRIELSGIHRMREAFEAAGYGERFAKAKPFRVAFRTDIDKKLYILQTIICLDHYVLFIYSVHSSR